MKNKLDLITKNDLNLWQQQMNQEDNIKIPIPPKSGVRSSPDVVPDYNFGSCDDTDLPF